jgi:hypothetical protein
MPEESFQLLVNDPMTGVPSTVELSPAALQQALIKDPALLVGALKEALLQRYDPRAQQPKGIPGPNTPITELIPPGEVSRLSSAARRLTKADLMAMAGWGGQPRKDPAQLGLDVEDINTIRDIFGQQLGAEVAPMGFSLSCCSCTPCCCCAVAAVPPTRVVF